MSHSLYEIEVRRLDGERVTLNEYRGQVLLIVNVASKCGLTPQYTGLERLYESYRDRGFAVLGFPCNDFAAQEPGTEAEIGEFCETRYGVRFPIFAKVNVNSAPRHPLYFLLIAARPEAVPSGNSELAQALSKHGLLPQNPDDVLWNFEKFLVGRGGEVVERFAPDMAPEHPALVGAVEVALGPTRTEVTHGGQA